MNDNIFMLGFCLLETRVIKIFKEYVFFIVEKACLLLYVIKSTFVGKLTKAIYKLLSKPTHFIYFLLALVGAFVNYKAVVGIINNSDMAPGSDIIASVFSTALVATTFIHLVFIYLSLIETEEIKSFFYKWVNNNKFEMLIRYIGMSFLIVAFSKIPADALINYLSEINNSLSLFTFSGDSNLDADKVAVFSNIAVFIVFLMWGFLALLFEVISLNRDIEYNETDWIEWGENYWDETEAWNKRNEDVSWQNELRILSVSDENEKKEILNKFNSEFEARKNLYPLLIIHSKSLANEWTITGFNANHEFKIDTVNHNSGELYEELKKEYSNKNKIIDLVKLQLSCIQNSLAVKKNSNNRNDKIIWYPWVEDNKIWFHWIKEKRTQVREELKQNLKAYAFCDGLALAHWILIALYLQLDEITWLYVSYGTLLFYTILIIKRVNLDIIGIILTVFAIFVAFSYA